LIHFYKRLKMSLATKLVQVKPHIPLIKFRKGGPFTQVLHQSEHSTNPPPNVLSGVKMAAQPALSLDWWELPQKYRKFELDDKEIESINGGGSDKLWN